MLLNPDSPELIRFVYGYSRDGKTFQPAPREDWGERYLCLRRCCERFDPDAGTPFHHLFNRSWANWKIDEIRKEAKRAHPPLVVDPRHESETPLSLLILSEEKKERSRVIVETLTSRRAPAMAKTLELRLAGDSYEDIAQKTGKTVGAVGSDLHHARKVIREQLTPTPQPEPMP